MANINLYTKAFRLGRTYLFGNIAQRASSIILIPLYTSYLNPKDFGILALMGITIDLLSRMVNEPIGSALGRYYYKPDYLSKNRILLFNLFLLLCLQTIALALVYWYFAKIICLILLSSEELLSLVQLYGFILILTPVSTYLLFFTRLREKAGFYVVISLIKLFLSAGLTIYLLVFVNQGVLSIIYGNILGLAFISLVCIPLLIQHADFKVSTSVIKEPLKFGYPMLLAGYSNFFIQLGDRYVLRIFTSVANVGLYSFGYKIGQLIEMILVTPISEAFTPTIRKLESDPDIQKRFLSNSATICYLIGTYICLIMSLFSKEIVMVLARNPKFWPCWTIIPIVSFAYVQHALSSFLGWGMAMKNKPYHISGIMFISALVNLTLNFILIPIWGFMGAAIATLLSYFVWNSLKMYYSAKFYQLYFDIGRLSYITIIGIGLYLLSAVVVTSDHISITVLFKLAIILAYPLFFFLSNFFNHKEKEHIKRLWEDIKSQGFKIAFSKMMS